MNWIELNWIELHWSELDQQKTCDVAIKLTHPFKTYIQNSNTFGAQRSLLIFEWEIISFSKTYVTSEEAVSHNVLYFQQLPYPLYQVSFYANNNFE